MLAQYKSRAPQNISFNLIIDATGVVPGVTSIDQEIGKFKNVAYRFNGSVHSPNYLKLLWGKLVFDCMLKSMDISYQLFAPSGVPLRASLALSFRQHQTPADLARDANKESADLTHSRITSGDTNLPLMCHRVYDDSALYPQVARVNNLNNLMQLPAHARLRFPPVEEA